MLNIGKGILKTSYKNMLFKLNPDTGNYEYESTVNGTLKKGLRNWKGTFPVKVILEKQEFNNGGLIKEPSGSRDSHVVITTPSDKNVYFYLKCTSDPANDLSFVISKGTTTRVDVPCCTYEFYVARGDTWYGADAVFGPNTLYEKENGSYSFSSSEFWTVDIGVENGNTGSNMIGADEFPGK